MHRGLQDQQSQRSQTERIQKQSLPEHPCTVDYRTSKVKVDIDVAMEVLTLVVCLDLAALLPTMSTVRHLER